MSGAFYAPYYRDDLHIVTPFVRAAATDLNLTLGLGLFAFVAIQVFGVQALGISYFAKFINTPALGNMDKNPMGAASARRHGRDQLRRVTTRRACRPKAEFTNS